MLAIRLEVSDGGYVTDVEILPFDPLPEVVVWGTRYFVLHRALFTAEEKPVYREAFAYWVPPTPTHALEEQHAQQTAA